MRFAAHIGGRIRVGRVLPFLSFIDTHMAFLWKVRINPLVEQTCVLEKIGGSLFGQRRGHALKSPEIA